MYTSDHPHPSPLVSALKTKTILLRSRDLFSMAEKDCVGTDGECWNSCTPEFSANKCPISSPTLLTPHREEKRIPLRDIANRFDPDSSLPRISLRLEPRTLIRCEPGTSRDSKEKWTDDELKALTEFILFHTSGESWPAHKQEAFWESAAKFLHQRVDTVPRSGKY